MKGKVVEKSHKVKDFVLRRDHEAEFHPDHLDDPMEIIDNCKEEALLSKNNSTVTEDEQSTLLKKFPSFEKGIHDFMKSGEDL